MTAQAITDVSFKKKRANHQINLWLSPAEKFWAFAAKPADGKREANIYYLYATPDPETFVWQKHRPIYPPLVKAFNLTLVECRTVEVAIYGR